MSTWGTEICIQLFCACWQHFVFSCNLFCCRKGKTLCICRATANVYPTLRGFVGISARLLLNAGIALNFRFHWANTLSWFSFFLWTHQYIFSLNITHIFMSKIFDSSLSFWKKKRYLFVGKILGLQVSFALRWYVILLHYENSKQKNFQIRRK